MREVLRLGPGAAILDGDFHVTDLGETAHDVVVYSNIAHGESAERWSWIRTSI